MLTEDEKIRLGAAPVDSVPRTRAADGRPPLRIGLIVNSLFGSPYVTDLARWGQSREDLCISHLILNTRPHSPDSRPRHTIRLAPQRRPLELLQLAGLWLLTRIEGFALAFSRDYSKHLKTFDLTRVVPRTLEVRPIISESGRVYRYTDEDLLQLKALGLDLLIHCAPVMLDGGVLNVARFGTLSIHYGNRQIGVDEPSGFWELYLRRPTSGFVIRRLSDDQDRSPILLRGSIRTVAPYLLNQAALYAKATFHLKRLVAHIAGIDALPRSEESRIYFDPPRGRPSLRTQVAYALTCAWRVFSNPLRRFLLGRHEHWSVAFSYGDWKSLVMWRATRLKCPPNHFLADPFVIRESGADYCFVEDYDCRKSRACISTYRLTESGAHRLGEAIVEPFHMSYPYLFRFDGKLYMCPETSEQREIRIYECTDFPLKWRLAKVAMSNVSAADSVIFERGGKWWLFTNIDPLNRRDHSSELHIFHADSPLSDAWTPHPLNPVLLDAARARNGGIVFDQGCVYRISQIPGFLLYGKGFAVNRLCNLTETEFSEERLYEVQPHFFKHLRGTHHLNTNGYVCVFDFSRGETCIHWPFSKTRYAAAEHTPRSTAPPSNRSSSSLRTDVPAGLTR